MSLPLSVFEEYMLLDDSFTYPMDSFRMLRFSGDLELDILKEAVASTVRQHPMLRSIVCHEKGNRFTWQEVEYPLFFKLVQTKKDFTYPNHGRLVCHRGLRFLVDSTASSFSKKGDRRLGSTLGPHLGTKFS